MAKNDNLFKKLTKLFKSGPVVKRKIRSADTAVAVPDKTGSSGAMLFQKSSSPTYASITANAYNLSERLARYQDFCEMEYCLKGDTLIPQLDGTYRTIESLAEECKDDPTHTFFVYAYDHNLKRIVPALGKQARQTRVDHAYKVMFDNGKEIIGTGNHRLMKRDGTYCKIEDLQPNTAMMLYTKASRDDVDRFNNDNTCFLKQCDPKFRSDLTFGRILEISETCEFDVSKLCNALDVTQDLVENKLLSHGFESYEMFASTYRNTNSCQVLYTGGLKVVSVEYYGVIPLYDLTVDGYKNFATDTVISHNTPEIASAMDIYADETVSQDDKGNILHVYSDNEKIKEILEDLFFGVLNVDFNMRSWVRNLVKYGDLFMYNDVSPTHGVINSFPIPVNEIEREENYDPEDPFAVRFRWVSLGNRVLENWEISHFRLLGNDMFLPYGSSLIEPARRIWRQLILIEDAMLVYRVVRAPERRVFYIDVANIPADDVPLYMEEQKKQLRSAQVVDSQTARVDLRYNPLSVDEDYFIPVRGGETGTKIETLAPGQNTGTVEDVAYIQKKLFAALKVPKAYLGYDEALGSKATLAQEDIRFSRSIGVIQKTIIAELNKIAIIHLYANGYENEDLVNFTLQLSNPSTVAQQQKLELWRSKFEIAGSAPEGMLSKPFIYKNIMSLNEEEIDVINKQRLRDKLIDLAIDAEDGSPGEFGGGGGGGGGGPAPTTPDSGEEGFDDFSADAGDTGDLDDVGDDIFDDDEETPPEENAGEEPEEEEEDVDLLTSSDTNDSDHIALPSSDIEKPIKVSSQLNKAIYNRSRRRTHGASKTHMPDFVKMTSHSDPDDALKDPFDKNFMKSLVSNPLGESVERDETRSCTVHPRLGIETTKMLESFSRLNKISREGTGYEVDVQDEIDLGTLLNEGNDVDTNVDDELVMLEHEGLDDDGSDEK